MKTSLQFTGYSLRMLALSCVLCLASFHVYSQSPAETYKAANALYKAGSYEEAAASYEKILAQGYRTADVYYNLGNCFYKLKENGKAILNYERARKLAPDDEDIAHNLKIAQLKTLDKVQPVPQLAITTAWNNFTTSQTSKGWSYFAVAFMWLAL